MEIIRYMPSCFDKPEKTDKIKITSTEQLYKIDWVKAFSNCEDFYRFSLERDKTDCVLMAEYKNGEEWYVVSRIKGDDISPLDDIPEWIAKYTNGAMRRKMAEEIIRIPCIQDIYRNKEAKEQDEIFTSILEIITHNLEMLKLNNQKS